jgi:hypothetical protein
VVLNASGCREGWLQGEAFRFFRSKKAAIYTNYLPLHGDTDTGKKTADFAFYESDDDTAKLELVAELKVYGELNFQTKIVTGGGLREVKRRIAEAGVATFDDNLADRNLQVGWGLLSDYYRLVDFNAGSDKPARMLILCVQKADVPDTLGKILSKIEFEAAGTTLLDTPQVWVKAWFVGGGGKRG